MILHSEIFCVRPQTGSVTPTFRSLIDDFELSPHGDLNPINVLLWGDDVLWTIDRHLVLSNLDRIGRLGWPDLWPKSWLRAIRFSIYPWGTTG